MTHNGNPICLKANLSAETLQARREWLDIVNVLKGEDETIETYSMKGKDETMEIGLGE